MGINTITPSTTALQPTNTYLPVLWGYTGTITAISITASTDWLITFSNNHNFKLGQTVNIQGVVTSSGDTPSGVFYIKAVPAANQIRIYDQSYGATISYTSGGLVTAYYGFYFSAQDAHQQWNGLAKYVNNKYFISDYYGNLFWSNDGITWNWTYPLKGGFSTNLSYWLNDIDYDGTVYATCDQYGNISTSPDLVTWTARVNGSGTPISAIKWCGGNYQAWVAVGGSANTYYISTAASGGATWTSRSTTFKGKLLCIEFDGNTTVVIGGGNYDGSNAYMGWVYSTTATTWTGVQTTLYDTISQIIYNPNVSLWYFYARDYIFGPVGIKTTATISSATNNYNDATIYPSAQVYSQYYRQNATYNASYNVPFGHKISLDIANNVFYCPTTTNHLFLDNKYSFAPTTITDPVRNTVFYSYTKLATNSYNAVDNQIISLDMMALNFGFNMGQASSFVMYIWGGGKWIVFAPNGNSDGSPQKIVVLQ